MPKCHASQTRQYHHLHHYHHHMWSLVLLVICAPVSGQVQVRVKAESTPTVVPNETRLDFPADPSKVLRGFRLRKVTLLMPREVASEPVEWFVAAGPGQMVSVGLDGSVPDPDCIPADEACRSAVDVTSSVEYWLDARVTSYLLTYDGSSKNHRLQFVVVGSLDARANWNNSELVFESEQLPESCWIKNSTSFCSRGQCEDELCLENPVCVNQCGRCWMKSPSSYCIRGQCVETLPKLCIMNVGCIDECGLMCDFEQPCAQWQWNDSPGGIRLTLAEDLAKLYANHSIIVSGPQQDASDNAKGHFLYLSVSNRSTNRTFNITSSWFNSIAGNCELHFYVHSNQMPLGSIQVIAVGRSVVWEVKSNFQLIPNKWHELSATIGKIKQPIQIIIDIQLPTDNKPAHVALDNLRLVNCVAESPLKETCHEKDFHCSHNDNCIDRSFVCDLHEQCFGGDDEKQDCDKVPLFARCNFENKTDMFCGWHTDRNDPLEWKTHMGKLSRAGPFHDHTFKNNSLGTYMFLETVGATRKMGDHATFRSPTILPPPRVHGNIHSPYYNSCQVRFYYFMSDLGDLELYTVEEPYRPGENPKMSSIWFRKGKQGHNWERAVVTLPRILRQYHLVFEGRRSFRSQSSVAIDDISMSPECFGIGVNVTDSDINNKTNVDEVLHYTVIHLSTCGGQGRSGPNQMLCDESYRHSVASKIRVDQNGAQLLTVNDTGFYSVIANGASGGKGFQGSEKSRGAMARGVFHWHGGDVIHFVVGHEGGSSCQWGQCRSHSAPTRPGRNKIDDLARMISSNKNNQSSGGGGGGGATYAYKWEEHKMVPILVASGGGGISSQNSIDRVGIDGQGVNSSALPVNGDSPFEGAGGGGGWNDTRFHKTAGVTLVLGAAGGPPCETVKQWEAEGGFGGGGGACAGGGGGGGYRGGNAPNPDSPTLNGQGGTSYVSGDYSLAIVGGATEGPGSVDIIPAFEGCDCSYLCVVLDLQGPVTGCICPKGRQLKKDNVTCEVIPPLHAPGEILGLRVQHVIIILICAGIVMASIAAISFFLYHRYRRQKMQNARQELFSNTEMQLNRIRQQGGGGMVTDPNPNYEFGGSTCTLQDLKEISRDDLTLINALGQGAFGEVYQGLLRNVPEEVTPRDQPTRELPVAVKTLPDISSSQAEMDFLMEALIMSKFKHPNIVRFLGVCFDKLPKFIVLELLLGGDLKSFLRESRPKPGRASPLTMCDLLMLAMDIAKGCHYLEENHFIHRDIAARNCLLTTKGPDRVVKIADFGMARDIYRADYYRKGGKAMLPVKWMPPEAFLDGIFTSKTDVWSFGVLLWEVISLGYMPYPGRGNHEVMQLVTSGGRLEPPSNCPSPVYHIMSQCWNARPEQRPNFSTILERLGYCLQDPDVIRATLPVFHRPPSTERDTTIMRPPDSDAPCLLVQRPDTEPVSPASTDYLIPIPSSNYSLNTEKTELPSGSSVESIDKLLDLEDNSNVPAPPAPSPVASGSAGRQWDGSNFTNPHQLNSSSPQSVKKRAGGYTSIPTQEEPVDGLKTRLNKEENSAVSGRSPSASIARQRPIGNPKSDHLISLDTKQPAVKSGVSLDASALAKQHMGQPYSYTSVDAPSGMSNGGPNKPGDGKADPYFIGMHYLDRTKAAPPDKVSC